MKSLLYFIVLCTIPIEPSKQGQEDLAKVLFASHVRLTSSNCCYWFLLCITLQEWKPEFPLNEWVTVKHEEEVNHVFNNGRLKSLVYKKVRCSSSYVCR